MNRGFWIVGALLIAACVMGCDREDGTTADGSPAAPSRVRPVYGTGSIKGVVKFIGTPPPRAAIANQPCHEGAPELKDETTIVNANGTLANTFVYLAGVASSDGSERAPALLDQKDCRYTPHVVGVQVGQTLRIHSSDPTMHNVHYNPTDNESGNFGMTVAGAEKSVTFKQPEFIRVKCDVHPWMTAYIGVFDSPFFTSTSDGDPLRSHGRESVDSAGSFNIEKAPAGTYTLVAWHELYGEMKQQITVKENESIEVSFEYKAQ